MKFLPLAFLLLVVCTGFFMRSQQPKDWNNLLESLKAPGVASSSPEATPATGQPPDAQTAAAPTPPAKRGVEYITPETTKFVSTDHVTDVPQPNQHQPASSPAAAAGTPKVFVPPTPSPAQPAWVWTTSDGAVYNNVIIEKVEADRVTIYCDKGSAVITTANLPPDVQRLLNYDPDLATQAAMARSTAPTPNP